MYSMYYSWAIALETISKCLFTHGILTTKDKAVDVSQSQLLSVRQIIIVRLWDDSKARRKRSLGNRMVKTIPDSMTGSSDRKWQGCTKVWSSGQGKPKVNIVILLCLQQTFFSSVHDKNVARVVVQSPQFRAEYIFITYEFQTIKIEHQVIEKTLYCTRRTEQSLPRTTGKLNALMLIARFWGILKITQNAALPLYLK